MERRPCLPPAAAAMRAGGGGANRAAAFLQITCTVALVFPVLPALQTERSVAFWAEPHRATLAAVRPRRCICSVA